VGAVLALAACTSTPVAKVSPPPSTSPPPSSPSISPSPEYPPYYIESLRALPRTPGKIELGQQVGTGSGFTRFEMTWTSQGKTMTGTIAIPAGTGPFPVVIANHGYLPASEFTPGVDMWKYGDPLSSHGFISIAPSYPGYGGSDSLNPPYPQIIGQVVADYDLVSSLASIPQADPARVAMIGHSNGGGVALLMSVIDPRVKVYVLFAPVSSDMADNYRAFWHRSTSSNSVFPSPEANPDLYAHISPRNYFTSSTAPMLFLQGTADAEIPAAWTNASILALQQRGATADVTWYPGATHAFYYATLAAANGRAEAWIRKYLG